MKINLDNGTICNVLIRGQRRILRRIFKWNEKRFGDIDCYVFSSPVRAHVRTTWDPAEKSLTIHGAAPASEVSVPHYDLLLCEPHRNLSPKSVCH